LLTRTNVFTYRCHNGKYYTKGNTHLTFSLRQHNSTKCLVDPFHTLSLYRFRDKNSNVSSKYAARWCVSNVNATTQNSTFSQGAHTG